MNFYGETGRNQRLNNRDAENGERKVCVVARIRPCLRPNNETDNNVCVRGVDDTTLLLTKRDVRGTVLEEHDFVFDNVFDTCDTQENVFNECVEDLTAAAFAGQDLTIMAYGQTGSGKTYTLLGGGRQRDSEEMYPRLTSQGFIHTEHSLHVETNLLKSDFENGLLLRVASKLLEHRRRQPNLRIEIYMSAVEVYQDRFRDLLQDGCIIGFRESEEDIILINKTLIRVASLSDVISCLNIANKARSVAQTQANRASSRSHAIFSFEIDELDSFSRFTESDVGSGTIVLDLSHHDLLDEGIDAGKISFSTSQTFRDSIRSRHKITFIDLAGSERIKRSGAEGKQLSEALFVNKSLSALGKVVRDICSNARHIPFRESKLTRILRPSLISPRSRILLIANVSPTLRDYSEILGTLRFADRIKHLRPVPTLDRSFSLTQEREYFSLKNTMEGLCTEARVAFAGAGYVRQLSRYSTASSPCRIQPLDQVISAANFYEMIERYRNEVAKERILEKARANAKKELLLHECLTSLSSKYKDLEREKIRVSELKTILDEEDEIGQALESKINSLRHKKSETGKDNQILQNEAEKAKSECAAIVKHVGEKNYEHRNLKIHLKGLNGQISDMKLKSNRQKKENLSIDSTLRNAEFIIRDCTELCRLIEENYMRLEQEIVSKFDATDTKLTTNVIETLTSNIHIHWVRFSRAIKNSTYNLFSGKPRIRNPPAEMRREIKNIFDVAKRTGVFRADLIQDLLDLLDNVNISERDIESILSPINGMENSIGPLELSSEHKRNPAKEHVLKELFKQKQKSRPWYRAAQAVYLYPSSEFLLRFMVYTLKEYNLGTACVTLADFIWVLNETVSKTAEG